MQRNIIFIIGSPRSGSTMLQRMIGSHSAVHTHPEPHIVTPLAHLGFYANVDKAPYDHINAAQAIKEYVADLPGGEQDYYDACAAYLDVLYGRMLTKSGKKMMLDKTPAYALVWPYLTKVYPDAKYIILTRHPLAILSSYANSFFEGDYGQAIEFNNILGRYVPAIASMLRFQGVDFHRVSYEHLVSSPEKELADIFDYLGLPNEQEAVNYGEHQHVIKSYGDPKASQQKRPSTKSIGAWAEDMAANPDHLEKARQVVAAISAEDFATFGYDKKSLFDKVEKVSGIPRKKDRKWTFNSYRMKRKIFLSLRKDIHQKPLGRVLRRVKYYCDVLLRE